MKNNKIAESIQKIMPDEASREQILQQILVRANTDNSTIRKENQDMNTKSRSVKKLATVIIAAVFTLSLLTFVGFAYGGQIIQLLGGGRIEMGKNDNGDDFISISVFDSSPVEIRDGRVYFILDGNDTDITDFCTESTYYEYEQITDSGIRHVFIVGGTPDNLGWGEFIWNNTVAVLGSRAVYNEDADGEAPEWLTLAIEALLDY